MTASALNDALHAAAADERGLTFARFMALALYGPGGYYTEAVRIGGAGGDFFTAAQSPLFASAIANFVRDAHANWGRPSQLQIVEMGAGQGELAANLMDALRSRLPVDTQLLYTIVERSPHLQSVQRERLQNARDAGDAWAVRWGDPLAGIATVAVANEVLDALPVERVRRTRAGWEQAMVALAADGTRQLQWRQAERQLADVADRWLPVPDGTVADICLDYAALFGRFSEVGPPFAGLFIDYGITSEEWANGVRPFGTVRGYAAHEVVDVLQCPGRRDITADVHWDYATACAESVGLQVVRVQSQGSFLVEHDILGALSARSEGDGVVAASERNEVHRMFAETALAGQLKQLILPGGMGERFQVMICQRTE